MISESLGIIPRRHQTQSCPLNPDQWIMIQESTGLIRSVILSQIRAIFQ